jgi:hypothetical protein
MRTLVLLALCTGFPVVAGPPPAEEACALSGPQVEKLTGLKVTKRETYEHLFNQVICKYTLESGFVEFFRVTPETYSVETDTQLAAKLAEEDKPRLLKDFPVPAYSASGAVTVVLPKGVWRVQVMHGPKRGLDAMKLARALIDTKK